MVHYHGKRYNAAAIAARIVDVQCEKCGCKYFYEFARIGTGSAVAPYGIGKSSARASADEQSRRDLANRLAHEAELVPCPNCHWINEALVAGYRLGQFRQMGTRALYIGIVGTCTSLIGAWYVSRGMPVDQAAAPLSLRWSGPLCFPCRGDDPSAELAPESHSTKSGLSHGLFGKLHLAILISRKKRAHLAWVLQWGGIDKFGRFG